MAKVKPDLKAAHVRYKLADGTTVPGASTIAKVAGAYWSQGTLITWANSEGLAGRDCNRVRDEAGNAGTLAHALIEAHVRGDEVDTSEFAPSMVEAAEHAFLHWLEWWETKGFQVIALEESIVSEKHRFGGTLDMILRDPDGRLILADWKSGKGIYPEAWAQIAGYWLLWESQDHAEPLSGALIGRIGKDAAVGDCEFIERANLDSHKRWFLSALDLYYAQKEVK